MQSRHLPLVRKGHLLRLRHARRPRAPRHRSGEPLLVPLSELGQTSAHRLAVADPSARERRPAEVVLAPSRELVGCADR